MKNKIPAMAVSILAALSTAAQAGIIISGDPGGVFPGNLETNPDTNTTILVGFGGNAGTLELNAETTPNNVTAITGSFGMVVGSGPNAPGELRLTGRACDRACLRSGGTAGFASITLDGAASFGGGSNADIQILSGGQFVSAGAIDVSKEGFGSVGVTNVLVDGANSILSASDDFSITRDGAVTNTVTISNGGELRVNPTGDGLSGNIFIGRSLDTGSGAILNVTGAGSRLTHTLGINVGVGSNGNNQLNILDGAVLNQANGSGTAAENQNFTSLLIASPQGQAQMRVAGSQGRSITSVFLNRNVQIGGINLFAGQDQNGVSQFSDSSGSLIVEDGASFETDGNIFVSEKSSTGSGVLSVRNGASLSAASITLFDGGILNGAGGFVNADVIVDGGTVAPGNSPGLMNINGNLSFETIASLLEIEIGGTNEGAFDVLAITGDLIAANGFTLELSFLNGFTPQNGDIFNFLQVGGTTALDLALIQIITNGLVGNFEFALSFVDGMASLITTTAPVNEVPIPGALLLMISGLAGLGFAGRKKRQSA